MEVSANVDQKVTITKTERPKVEFQSIDSNSLYQTSTLPLFLRRTLLFEYELGYIFVQRDYEIGRALSRT